MVKVAVEEFNIVCALVIKNYCITHKNDVIDVI